MEPFLRRGMLERGVGDACHAILAIAFGAAVAGGLCEPAGAVVMQASYSGTVFDAYDATDIFDTGGALNGSAFELLFIFHPDTPGIERETDAMHDYARGGSDRGLASQHPIRAGQTINAHTVSVDGRDAANALTDVASGIDDTPGFVSQGFFRRSVMGDLLDQRVFGVTMHGPAGTFAPDLEASIPFTPPRSRICPKDRLIEAMTGEQVNFGFADAVGRTVPADAAVALEVADLAGEDFRGVSFAVRRGEVVGIAGATSSGRVGVAEAVAGLGRHTAGAIRIDGRALPSGDVPAALALGVGCVPKSRHAQGLVMSQSVADNTTMTISDRLGSLGFIAPKRKTEKARAAIRDLGVVTEGPDQLVSALSGGNQQKVVMGRALANDPSVLVLMDPTAGVDVKSKEALLAVVERMRREGKAILVVSGELEDLRTCDRVPRPLAKGYFTWMRRGFAVSAFGNSKVMMPFCICAAILL